MPEINIQRNYKDTLFRKLFREKANLLSLYNALNGSSYDNPDDLTINTLENTLYLGMQNDVSFLIDDYLNLYEAQSTWNPNMPLRDFIYLERLYSGYIAENDLDIFGAAKICIPTPHCIVFYNGETQKEDRKILRLSDSFIQPPGQEPALECVVTCLNINYGHNKELMEQCQTLNGYAILIDQIRQQLALQKPLDNAVEHAVKYCIEHDILADFLRSHRMEVIDMLLAEYDAVRHIKSEKEVSYQEGYDSGYNSGTENGIRILIEQLAEMNHSPSDICNVLCTKYTLTPEQALAYIEKYPTE